MSWARGMHCTGAELGRRMLGICVYCIARGLGVHDWPKRNNDIPSGAAIGPRRVWLYEGDTGASYLQAFVPPQCVVASALADTPSLFSQFATTAVAANAPLRQGLVHPSLTYIAGIEPRLLSQTAPHSDRSRMISQLASRKNLQIRTSCERKYECSHRSFACRPTLPIHTRSAASCSTKPACRFTSHHIHRPK